jgi:hypothetical protein
MAFSSGYMEIVGSMIKTLSRLAGGANMPSRDQEIYQELAQVLYDVSLDDSVLVRFKVELADVGEPVVAEYHAVAINAEGKRESDIDNSNQYSTVTDALYELRDFFIKNGQPSWNVCELEFNIITKELYTSFVYN